MKILYTYLVTEIWSPVLSQNNNAIILYINMPHYCPLPFVQKNGPDVVTALTVSLHGLTLHFHGETHCHSWQLSHWEAKLHVPRVTRSNPWYASLLWPERWSWQERMPWVNHTVTVKKSPWSLQSYGDRKKKITLVFTTATRNWIAWHRNAVISGPKK